MIRTLFNAIIFSIFIISSTSFAKISITNPKDGDWLLPLDEDRLLEISGTSKDLSVGTELVLSISKPVTTKNETWKSKIEKDGSFSFKISQLKIPTFMKTTLTVDALGKDSNKMESASQDVYCCSEENAGLYSELNPARSYDFKISKPKKEIDEVEIKIPKGTVTSKDGRLLVYKAFANGIPLDKYIPLSAAIGVAISNVKTRVGIQYSMKMDPRTPREGTTNIVTIDAWSNLADKEWKDVDLQKAKIVILASDYSGTDWSEILPEKVDGNTVTFKQSEKNKNFAVFVVAAYANH